MISLDLGSGPNPQNPFDAEEVWGIDVNGGGRVKSADLVLDPIPWPDSSVDFITARDFLEHIPRIAYINGRRRLPFIDLMNEIWRVLVPGGKFFAQTPALPHQEAFVDPTHVNYITTDTLSYFTEHEITEQYGFKGKFEGAQYWAGYWLVWDIAAVKPT